MFRHGLLYFNWCFICFVLSSNHVHALVLLGVHTPSSGHYQSTSTAELNYFELNPTLGLWTRSHMGGSWFFVPELSWTYGLSSSTQHSRHTITAPIVIARAITMKFLLRAGLVPTMTMIRGKGGGTEMPNGDSTATFQNPSFTVRSYHSALGLGGEYVFSSQWSVRADVHFARILNNERRSWGHLLSINYRR